MNYNIREIYKITSNWGCDKNNNRIYKTEQLSKPKKLFFFFYIKYNVMYKTMILSIKNQQQRYLYGLTS